MFNSVLASDSLHATVHGNAKMWIVIVTVVAFVIAMIGYDIIHRAEQLLTYAMIVIFGLFTIALFLLHYPAGTFDVGTFHPTPFLAQFGVVAGYQISWAIYVSDYSRYMHPDVTVRKTFYWTYWGSALGGGWMMIVGSVLVAWVGRQGFDGTGIAEIYRCRQPRLQRLRRDRAAPRRARADLGDGAEHVRRVADPDQRDRLVQTGAADVDDPGGHRRADRRALPGRCARGDRTTS